MLGAGAAGFAQLDRVLRAWPGKGHHAGYRMTVGGRARGTPARRARSGHTLAREVSNLAPSASLTFAVI